MSVSIGPKKLGGAAGPGDGVGPRRSARRAKTSIGGSATPSIFDLASRGGRDAVCGAPDRSGSNAPATNRGDDLCCLRVFRCPVASLRTERGEIVLNAPGRFWPSGRTVSRQRAKRLASLRSLKILGWPQLCGGSNDTREHAMVTTELPRQFSSPVSGPVLVIRLSPWENPS